MRPTPCPQALAGALIVLTAGLALAADPVGVPGSTTKYPTALEVTVAEKPVRLNLTGAAMRRRTIINVYTIASYLQADVKVKTAEQLLAADAVKLLHMVMERDVTGKDMADAIRTGIQLNHRAETFAAELAKFDATLKSLNLVKNQNVFLTSIPKVGLRCQVPGKANVDVLIESPAFAKAVWDIYFGRNNLGDTIKNNLTSRF